MNAVNYRTQTGVRAQEQARAVPWWLVLIEGIAALAVGVFLVLVPAETTLILVQFLGIYWLITGILSIVSLFMDRAHWGWKLISGILGIAAGFIIIQHPIWSAVIIPTTLIIIIAALGVAAGIAFIIMAFRGGGWGAGILGVVSIILGVILFMDPFIAAAALPYVLGAFAIVGGIASIVASFSLRSTPAVQPGSGR